MISRKKVAPKFVITGRSVVYLQKLEKGKAQKAVPFIVTTVAGQAQVKKAPVRRRRKSK
jgi:hypothetical protein